MNIVGVLLFLLVAPVFAVGVNHLQTKLECWEYQRRAQD